MSTRRQRAIELYLKLGVLQPGCNDDPAKVEECAACKRRIDQIAEALKVEAFLVVATAETKGRG